MLNLSKDYGPPAGSFLNPYRQKAIDFSDEEIPFEKIFAKPETKDDFTLNKPLNIADSADLVKEKSEEQAAVKTEEESESSEKITLPVINSRRYLCLIRRLLPKTITLKKEYAISAVFWNRLCLILR